MNGWFTTKQTRALHNIEKTWNTINSLQLITKLDPQGNILELSDQLLNAIGKSKVECVGTSLLELLCIDLSEEVNISGLWSHLIQEPYRLFECEYINEYTQSQWFTGQFMAVVNDHGTIEHVIVSLFDITEFKNKLTDAEGFNAAMNASQAIIEFTPTGEILSANDNFIAATGYRLDEIKGKHHRLFMPTDMANSHDYQQFWQRLASGQFQSGEFQRVDKSGGDLWLQASYNPIFDLNGKVIKIVKYAADITEKKLQSADYSGQISAIGKSQAVIEFDLNGYILNANTNFLAVTGYQLDEIKGQHHSLFVEKSFATSAEYKGFWQRLGAGEYEAGEYQRFGKGGEEIWIQASYNPIFDMNGNPFKVVKYASDITAQKLQNADYSGQISAIDKSQAVIEFDLQGNILNANDNFLAVTGYQLDEIKGQHHSLFVEKSYAASAEYKNFWQRLGAGEYEAGEYQRFGKGGEEIWIQASYNPIFDMNGKPFKVVKYASDITAQKLQNADYSGQISAIGKSQAVIEFDLQGNILNANDNFLAVTGYQLDEIKGQHHSLFVDKDYASSVDYKGFWQRLGAGEYESGEYQRFGKGGAEIWIQASYNPIFDMNGKPFKVVKYASDITGQKLQNADYSGQISAIGKSQAVIEFDLHGNILNANDNFLAVTGYQVDEIKGQHHSLFVEKSYAASAAYKNFWQRLGTGEYETGEYQRFGKGGAEIWIQASYNPIFDMNGKPFKVVKYASDITAQKLQNADYSGQISAIGKAQAVIEFDLQGNILTANDNFLVTLGYDLAEIKDKHHRLFVLPEHASSMEYQQFWQQLSQGVYQSGEFKRVGKHAKEVWIQASYNPILDTNGKPFKVVKFATDITQQKREAEQNKIIANQSSALTLCSTPVMLIDNNGTVSYRNNAVETMMKRRESMLKTALPHFSLERLIGFKISDFYPDPGQQQNLMKSLVSPQQQRFELAGLTFTTIASPWLDRNGERLGTVLEWTDLTEQVKTEREVEHVVQSVNQGNLSALIPTEDKDGFFLNVSEGLNGLTGTVNAFINDLSKTLNSMSEGCLDTLIENQYDGMFGEVTGAVNTTINQLDTIISEITTGAQSIRSANEEITSGNAQLSTRTEQQASNIEETASSIEELAGNVKSTANNALTANKAAEDARAQAQKGEEIVSDAVTSMTEITQSSNKIVEIISVIDDIAFQTNLLALNASVEAARAGEQGRGFAVVATEVRNLAQRSAVSAKEIKELIEDSSDKVNTGSRLVNDCGVALSTIIEHVSNLSELISDIASSTNEQATGINQVNQAVSELDEITQQNAALAEQTSSASQASFQQANDIAEQVDYFTTSQQVLQQNPSVAAKAKASTSGKRRLTASKQQSNVTVKTTPKPALDKQSDDKYWVEF